MLPAGLLGQGAEQVHYSVFAVLSCSMVRLQRRAEPEPPSAARANQACQPCLLPSLGHPLTFAGTSTFSCLFQEGQKTVTDVWPREVGQGPSTDKGSKSPSETRSDLPSNEAGSSKEAG